MKVREVPSGMPMMISPSPDVDAGGPEVAGDEDPVSGGAHGGQEAGGRHLHRHQVGQRLLAETLDDVLVVLHHVGGDAAVEAVGHLDGVVDRVLHQGPGREGGARHEDGAVEQACRG